MANEKCIGCDLYVNGHCTKFRKNGKAQPSTRDWLLPDELDEPFDFISVDRMCRKSSIFGNYYIGLTKECIERIKNGEVIHISGEYGLFIGLIETEETNV